MDSNPRRWVLRPLSPSLQPSDLRSISSQRDDSVFFPDSISIVGSHSAVYVDALNDSSADVLVGARQVSVSQDDGSSSSSSSSEELPLSPCSSSSGASQSGFYSFVDDPFSPEAEQNESWMTSPQRQTQLATLREENGFKLQSYSGYRRPGSLFRDESDSLYKIDTKHGYVVVGEQEERQLRKEIIRNQAPKKSPQVAVDGNGNDTNQLIEGLSNSNSHISAKLNVTVVSGSIDEEQINFDAARKQFLQMEQDKLDPIIRPRKIQVKSPPKSNPTEPEKVERWEEQVFNPKLVDVVETDVKEDRSSSSRQSSVFEESDRLSPNLDRNYGIANEPDPPQKSIPPEQETPIEREIRIAQEREENLRRSRGLQHSVSGEMVRIETKRLQSPLPLTPSRGKERSRVSFMFQEVQRKEEMSKQGGTKQDIRGPRRSSFEMLEADYTEAEAIQSNREDAISRAFERFQESAGGKFDVVDYALQKQRIQDNRQSSSQLLQDYVEPYLRNATPDQEVEKKHEEYDNRKSLDEHWKSQNQNGTGFENGFTGAAERPRADSISDDVFPLPCCPHKHPEDSEGVKQDAPVRSNLQTPSWRSHLEKTGLQTRGQGATDFIERDIEEALRREQELKEQREARVNLVFSPQTLVQQADKMAATQFYPQIRTDKFQSRSSSSPRPFMRLSGVPLMSPQPWSPVPQTPLAQTPQTPQTPQTHFPQIPQTPLAQTPQTHFPQTPQTPLAQTPQTPLAQTPQTPLAQIPQPLPQTPETPSARTPVPMRGLTHTLLQDFEERRVKMKLEESAYAGIQPVDSVNNEVVESTRVTRHKNKRALQWEAGFFANQQD